VRDVAGDEAWQQRIANGILQLCLKKGQLSGIPVGLDSEAELGKRGNKNIREEDRAKGTILLEREKLAMGEA